MFTSLTQCLSGFPSKLYTKWFLNLGPTDYGVGEIH